MSKITSKKKFKEYYNILNKWLSLKIYRKEIKGYFKVRNIHNIAIYGMGELGKRLCDDLRSDEEIDIKYFIDKGKVLGYNGMNVFSPKDFLPENIDAVIVSAIWDIEEIKSILESKIKCPIINLSDVINELMPQRIIPFLVISVGQACNFQCKECGTMAPYSPLEFKKYDVKNIIQELTYICNSIDYIEDLQIQGGEPFLYKDLDVLLKFLRTQKQIHEIEIATNGSIIPEDNILEMLHQYNIKIRISDYEMVRDKAAILKEKCEEFGIHVRYYAFTTGKSLWYSKGRVMNREKDDMVVRERFLNCDNNVCLTLERGSLSYCSRASNAYAIQNFQRSEKDICIVDNRDTLGEELMEYIHNKHPMEACYYCYGTDPSRMIPAAEQLDNR